MSAVWMARALQENGDGRLYCIDNFCWTDQPTQEQQWNANIDRCGVRDKVTLIKGRSQEVEWPGRVDFAYLDGNHTRQVCHHDLDRVLALGASCVAMNDTVTCEGARAVGEHFRREGRGMWDFLEVNFDAGLLIALKREPKPPVIQGDYDQWDKA
jgi:predicted O-methyltransferase YrrM